MSDAAALVREYRAKRPLYEAYTAQFAAQLGRLFADEDIPIQTILWRTKTVDSLAGKLARRDKDYTSLQDVPDLSALRVIVFRLSDCARVRAVLERAFAIDPEQTEDKRWDLDLQEFGYRAVHCGLRLTTEMKASDEWRRFVELDADAEVQIQTLLQHAWAEITHDLLYKAEEPLPRARQRRLYRLAGLLELADEELSALSADSSPGPQGGALG